MNKINEYTILLREHIELPASFKPATERFQEDWILMRTGNAERLRGKTAKHGWDFVKIDRNLRRSGVGTTSQLAIASAVKLALRNTSAHSNAAEVEHIALTQYPWFFLARVQVCSYLIEQNAVLPAHEDIAPFSPIPVKKFSSPSASIPDSGCAMPQLKQMLAIPQDTKSSEL